MKVTQVRKIYIKYSTAVVIPLSIIYGYWVERRYNCYEGYSFRYRHVC